MVKVFELPGFSHMFVICSSESLYSGINPLRNHQPDYFFRLEKPISVNEISIFFFFAKAFLELKRQRTSHKFIHLMNIEIG